MSEGPNNVDRNELTEIEELKLALAESRAREAKLASAIAQRAVVDTAAALEDTHRVIIEAALLRRVAAADKLAADEAAATQNEAARAAAAQAEADQRAAAEAAAAQAELDQRAAAA